MGLGKTVITLSAIRDLTLDEFEVGRVLVIAPLRVTIHHIITKNTVDEDVMAALASKDVTQANLIAAVKAQIG